MQTKSVIINKPVIEQIESQNKETVSVNIKRYTTDANGTILDDAAIPAALKKPYPFHLFGEFDMNGGYAIANRVLNKYYNSIFLGMYVWGVNTPLFFPNPLANVNNEFQIGDVLFVYVDDINNPTNYIFVVVSAQSGSWASIVKQLNTTQLDKNRWGVFKIFDCQYSWLKDTRLQLAQPLFTILSQWNADFLSNTITPGTYYIPDLKPNVNELIIPINMVANQFVGLSSFITYENPVLTLTFIIYV